MLSNVNPNAYFTMEWCKYKGDRNNREKVKVELVGAISGNERYPIQNLRASTNGTVIKTTIRREYEIGQELYFLGMWWTIRDVTIDLSEYAPQSAVYGDGLENAVYMLTISGTGIKK